MPENTRNEVAYSEEKCELFGVKAYFFRCLCPLSFGGNRLYYSNRTHPRGRVIHCHVQHRVALSRGDHGKSFFAPRLR